MTLTLPATREAARAWKPRPPDFLVHRTSQRRLLFTPFSGQGRWFLAQVDPDRLLPRLGPAVYLEETSALPLVTLLQESGLALRFWQPIAPRPCQPLPPLKPIIQSEPRGPRLSFHYDWNTMPEREATILTSILRLPPGRVQITIPLP